MLYQLHEWQRAFLGPMSYFAQASAKMFSAMDENHDGNLSKDEVSKGHERMLKKHSNAASEAMKSGDAPK